MAEAPKIEIGFSMEDIEGIGTRMGQALAEFQERVENFAAGMAEGATLGQARIAIGRLREELSKEKATSDELRKRLEGMVRDQVVVNNVSGATGLVEAWDATVAENKRLKKELENSAGLRAEWENSEQALAEEREFSRQLRVEKDEAIHALSLADADKERLLADNMQLRESVGELREAVETVQKDRHEKQLQHQETVRRLEGSFARTVEAYQAEAAKQNVPSMDWMVLQFLMFSEWLDVEGYSTDSDDGKTHEDLAKEYLAYQTARALNRSASLRSHPASAKTENSHG